MRASGARCSRRCKATLADVHAAVADWPRMQAAMQEDARTACPTWKAAALLRWLADGMLDRSSCHVIQHRDGTPSAQALGIWPGER